MPWHLAQAAKPTWNGSFTLPYRTDAIALAAAGTIACFDAALVHGTAVPLDKLGIVPLEPSGGARLTFKLLNRRLQASQGLGSLFVLRRPVRDLLVAHIFLATTGCFVIHCLYYHVEDMNEFGAQSIPHYIVYNADTRALFLYPQVHLMPDGRCCPLSCH